MPNSVSVNGILLQEPLVINHHREVMTSRDGMDYLCTANYVDVTGCYNPATNAFIGAPNSPVAKQSPGQKPATTFAAIRHQLEQVRGTVIVKNGNATIINQAAPDVRNGPFVKVHDIVEQMGVQTYVISLSFVTYMNEAKYFTGGAVSPILSHRYEMSDDYDEDFYLYRTVSGIAEFRGDELANIKAVPDQFRAYLWHQTPAGFKPERCRVHVSSDGLTVEYEILFKQRPILITAPGATRIEATDSMTLHHGNLADVVMGIAQGAASLSLTGTIKESFATGAPAFARRVHVRVWGLPNTPRGLLGSYAIRIILGRFGSMNNINLITNNHDLTGRYVEMVAEKSLGGIAGNWPDIAWGSAGWFARQIGQLEGQGELADALNQALTVFGSPKQLNGQSSDTAWISPNVIIDEGQSPKLSGPNLPSDQMYALGPGSRGTFLGAIVTAALLGQNLTPQQANDLASPNVQGATSLIPAKGKLVPGGNKATK